MWEREKERQREKAIIEGAHYMKVRMVSKQARDRI